MKKLLITALFVTLFLVGCSKNIEITNSVPIKQEITPKIYSINWEGILIMKLPDLKSEKLVNKKATELLWETQYATVDYSVKVIIEEGSWSWSRIKVVEPEHLSSTHKWWIENKYIKDYQVEDDSLVDKDKDLNKDAYEIIKTNHNSNVQNFYIYIKQKDFNLESVSDLIENLRKEICTKDCNIEIYDSKDISTLINKYPLEWKEYIKVADHFVAMSSFDAPSSVWWYPFQDFQYKEYGWTNWKKEPIK